MCLSTVNYHLLLFFFLSLLIKKTPFPTNCVAQERFHVTCLYTRIGYTVVT